ncbi:MAG TPA: tyrosine/phenylalanine carboxypeptidase domain-containing protein [Candidatus Saccharimonadales bacterium]|nr:tyrosine/phenylalanine carboxypeptidase domain-containing protein [Candidatus Saccharimonadales bacterium]
MKLLLVNNDSDTWQELYDLCLRCGYDVTAVHCSGITTELADAHDVTVLSGGYWYDDAEKHLSTYAQEVQVIRTATKPIVGICLGMQLMHIAYNGDVPLLDGPQNGLQPVAVTEVGQALLGLPPSLVVHKNHTRGVVLVDPAFAVLASSPGHIEIMMHTERPLLGMQFHPEIGDVVANTGLFKTLLAGVGAPVPGSLQTGLRITPALNALDAVWYEQLVQVAGVVPEIYTLLGPSPQDLRDAKAAFFASGKMQNPRLRPADFDTDAVLQCRAGLQQLLEQIQVQERNPQVRGAYEHCITELLQKIALLFAAQRGDDTEFARLNTQIHGSPKPEVLAAVLRYFYDQALAQLEHADSRVRTAAQNVLDVLPRMHTKTAVLTPDPAVFAEMKRRHEGDGGFYAELFADTPLPDDAVIQSQAGDVIVRGLLKNIGADNYDMLDAADGFWGVRYDPPAVVRPATYSLSREEFIATVGHEIGSHLLERLNGANQPLKLLGLGLQGYEAGNEGRAVLREQIVYADWHAWESQQRWQDILRRHLSISLALGVDDGQARSFAETFAIVHAIDLLWEWLHDSEAHVVQCAQDRTWELLVRSLKGTDGTGGAYHKDIAYLEGNLACWQVAATHPELIMAGDIGKFSVANTDHLKLLSQVGMLI